MAFSMKGYWMKAFLWASDGVHMVLIILVNNVFF